MKNCDRAKPQTQPFQWFLSFPAYRIFRRQNWGKIRYYEEAGNALFFAKTTTKSCREGGTEIGSGFSPFDRPHPEAAETGSGLRGFHRLSVRCQDSFRLCGSLRQPIHIWAQWVSAMTMASSGSPSPPSIIAPQSSQYFLVGLSQLPSVVMTKPHAEQHHSSPPRCSHRPRTTWATSAAGRAAGDALPKYTRRWALHRRRYGIRSLCSSPYYSCVKPSITLHKRRAFSAVGSFRQAVLAVSVSRITLAWCSESFRSNSATLAALSH